MTNHILEQVIGDVKEGVETRTHHNQFQNHYAFISPAEPKNIQEAIEHESWMLSSQEELNQLERSKVWVLVPRPKDRMVIGTK